MNKNVFSLIAVLVGMTFLAACQQTGTTSTGSNTGMTGASAQRNPPKTVGSATEAPSPIPSGAARGPGY